MAKGSNVNGRLEDGAKAVISARAWRRLDRAQAWLKAREPAEEVLIIGASLDSANELVD